MDPIQLLTFTGASVLLTLAPGPDILFVIAQGMGNGRRAAVLTSLGLCSGLIVHTLAAALGVSALFHTSALAFSALKYAGAAYLLYLAWKTLRDSSPAAPEAASKPPCGLALYRRGILMNLLNPKVSLFFLAFLPQFVSPAGGNVPAQMVMLGGIFMAQALGLFCLVGSFAALIGNRLLTRPGVARFLSFGSAAVFAGLGIRLALAEQ